MPDEDTKPGEVLGSVQRGDDTAENVRTDGCDLKEVEAKIEEFEDILSLVGSQGRWQLLVLALSALIVVAAGMFNTGIIFLAAEPKHRCAIPSEIANISNINNSSSTSLNNSRPETETTHVETNESILARWLPREENNTEQWSQCTRFQSEGTKDKLVQCDEWIFSRDEFQSTMVTEWNIVCQNKWKKVVLQMALMMGILIGAGLAGILGDSFGKRDVIRYSTPLVVILSILCVYVQHFYQLVILRILMPAANTLLYSSFFVLCMEIVGKDWRSRMGFWYQIPFAFGCMLFPSIAYYVRDWRHLHMCVSYPSLLFLLYIWLVPESPRWLASRQRFTEAAEVLNNIAKTNRRQPIDDATLTSMLKQYHSLNTDTTTQQPSKLASLRNAIIAVFGLVRTRRMRCITLAHLWNWAEVSFTYYGVVFDTTQLSDNKYLVAILAGAVETPAYLISAWFVDRWGRRNGLVLFHVMTAVSILIFALLPEHYFWLRLVLGAVGKFAVTAAFALLFIYSCECFPTSVRNIGFAMCSITARFGGIAAPIVFTMTNIHVLLSSALFIGFSVVAAVVSLVCLPETLGIEMPETIDDIERGHFDRARRAKNTSSNAAEDGTTAF